MELPAITPLLLAYNERENLPRALERLPWAGRVVVVDSFSTDDTLELARAFPNVEMVQRRFDNHTDQWNFGLDLVRTPWVLTLDADYLVPPELAGEIGRLEPPADVAGYAAGFRYLVHGRPLRTTIYPPRVVLFRRDRARYRPDGHTQLLHTEGPVLPLAGKIDHDDRKPLARWLQSQDRYMQIEAPHLLSTSPEALSRPDRLRMKATWAPAVMFFYLLFGRGLILDGWPGWFYVLQRTLAEALLALRLLAEREKLENGVNVFDVALPVNQPIRWLPSALPFSTLSHSWFLPRPHPSVPILAEAGVGDSGRVPLGPGSHFKPYAPAWTWRRFLRASRGRTGRPGWLWLCLDVLVWLGIYGTAVELRGDVGYGSHLPFVSVDLLGLGTLVLALSVIGGYDRRTDCCSLGYMSEHILAVGSAALLASLLIYGVVSSGEALRPSRGALLISFALFVPASLAYRRFVGRMVATDTARKSFLVLGSGEMARRFYETYLGSQSRQRLRFVDVTAGGMDGSVTAGQPISGPDSPSVEGDVSERLAELGPESSGVIMAVNPETLSPALLDRLVRLHFQRVPVYTLESFYEMHWRRVPAHALNPVWPLQMGFQLARNSPYSHVKRLFDVVFSGFALVLLSPVLFLLTLGTWLDSGRPALFRQMRIGRDGRPFTILKFRTMHARPPAPEGTAATDAELYTQPGDRRVTRLGRWLRKLRLDELPQLWNVFVGDMSLIGPRAEWDQLAQRYERGIASYNFRHLVKPGITGWAQVNYPYGANDADALQKLKYDLYYIRHYSLKLDAMIFLKTMHVMLFGKGQ